MYKLFILSLQIACVLLSFSDASSIPETSIRDIQVNPNDCADVYRAGSTESGVYNISLPTTARIIEVYCDMSNGGGWTVFQRRVNDSVNFFKSWNKYRRGFGCLCGNHWLGNDILHAMTNADPSGYQLRIDTTTFLGKKSHNEYRKFSVGSKNEYYRLRLEDSNGNPDDDGKGLSNNNGHNFTTKNRDNDNFHNNCAKDEYKGGWWYSDNCGYTNLNGPYLNERKSLSGPNIFWHPSDAFLSIKFSEMKFRPLNFANE